MCILNRLLVEVRPGRPGLLKSVPMRRAEIGVSFKSLQCNTFVFSFFGGEGGRCFVLLFSFFFCHCIGNADLSKVTEEWHSNNPWHLKPWFEMFDLLTIGHLIHTVKNSGVFYFVNSVFIYH